MSCFSGGTATHASEFTSPTPSPTPPLTRPQYGRVLEDLRGHLGVALVAVDAQDVEELLILILIIYSVSHPAGTSQSRERRDEAEIESRAKDKGACKSDCGLLSQRCDCVFPTISASSLLSFVGDEARRSGSAPSPGACPAAGWPEQRLSRPATACGSARLQTRAAIRARTVPRRVPLTCQACRMSLQRRNKRPVKDNTTCAYDGVFLSQRGHKKPTVVFASSPVSHSQRRDAHPRPSSQAPLIQIIYFVYYHIMFTIHTFDSAIYVYTYTYTYTYTVYV